MVEQKPSDDEISSVRPSGDLRPRSVTLSAAKESRIRQAYQAKSVKVAQCRLLTMQRGVCCCVSYSSTESWVATA